MTTLDEAADSAAQAGRGGHGGVAATASRPGELAATRAGRVAAAGPVGGDGGVSSVQDGGGPELTDAHVSLIFWGTAWGNAATSPTAGAVEAALRSIVDGPWATQLDQYHGIGRAAIDQVVLATGSDAPAGFVESDIRSFVDARIDAGDVFAPVAADERLYTVILPTGHSSTDTTFVGRHQNYTRSDGAGVYYAWVTNDATLTGGNSIPKVFSHELCEALSDPKVSTGPTGITLNGNGDEIGDVCNGTWSIVDGHAEEAYWSAVDNRCVLPRWSQLPAVRGNPALVQGRFGERGNFETVSGAADGGLFHTWRNNDNSFMPWGGAVLFGEHLGRVDGVTMIQSNYGSPGNLELIANAGGRLHFLWRDSGPTFTWSGPYPLAPGLEVSGNPVLLQSRFGDRGNFELVVPAADGGLAHLWRNNDDPAMPWSEVFHFAEHLGRIQAVTMIQSNYGSPGNLELIANAGGRLHFLWRDSGPTFTWSGPYPLAPGLEVSGNPVLLQSRFGDRGNFELVVPAAGGGLAHLWRNNDDPAMPWSEVFHFAEHLGRIQAVTMIQSNYGSPGNLELIANAGGRLHFLWRDSGPTFTWSGPYSLVATTW